MLKIYLCYPEKFLYKILVKKSTIILLYFIVIKSNKLIQDMKKHNNNVPTYDVVIEYEVSFLFILLFLLV